MIRCSFEIREAAQRITKTQIPALSIAKSVDPRIYSAPSFACLPGVSDSASAQFCTKNLSTQYNREGWLVGFEGVGAAQRIWLRKEVMQNICCGEGGLIPNNYQLLYDSIYKDYK